MSSTLSEGVRVPDIGSVNWGADVNFNWGLLNTALANISGNVKTDVANTWTAPQTFTETISGSIDGVAARAVGDEDGNNIKAALAGKAADSAVVHLAGAETITGDKTWTGSNAFTNNLLVSDNTNKYLLVQNTSDDWVLGSSTPSSTKELGGIGYRDKNDSTTFYCITFHDASGNVYTRLNMRWKYTNGVKSTSGSAVNVTFELGLDNTGNKYVSTNGSWKASLTPYTSATYDLGTSSAKWKTLNGINPGALSLPGNAADRIDISGSLTNLDGTSNSYTPPVPGWLCIRVNGTAGNYIYIQQGSDGLFTRVDATGAGSHIYLIMPVLSGIVATIQIVAQSGLIARLYPCLGNV